MDFASCGRGFFPPTGAGAVDGPAPFALLSGSQTVPAASFGMETGQAARILGSFRQNPVFRTLLRRFEWDVAL